MKKNVFQILSIVAAILILGGCAVHQPSPLFTPRDLNTLIKSGGLSQKADNFIVILDASHSMADACCAEQKLYWAKAAAHGFNQTIPALDLKSGLVMFGYGLKSKKDAELIYGMKPYSKPELDQSIEKILYADGSTPMASALIQANNDLIGLDGRHALIIFSDGKSTDSYTLKTAKAISGFWGDRLCIYTVLIGKDPKGKKTMQAIADASGCGAAVTLDQVSTAEGMADFVEKVFFERAGTARPVPAKPKPAPEAPAVVEKIVLNAVRFDFDSARINPVYEPILDEAVSILDRHAGRNILVEGHTCSMGPESYNQGLSERRARSIKDYLVQKGLDANRLKVKGYGESRPVADNTTPDGRKKNRRVELKVLE